MKKYRPVSLKAVNSYSLCARKSKVSVESFATPHSKGDSLDMFFKKLPDVFAVRDFKSIVKAVISARQGKRPVILGMGAHPIKLGLSPIIIDLMKKYPAAFKREYDPASGVRFSAWVTKGGK